jgi:hypothetical protein
MKPDAGRGRKERPDRAIPRSNFAENRCLFIVSSWRSSSIAVSALEVVRRGEEHYKAKLTQEKIRDMVRLRREGCTLTMLAEMFGVHRQTISDAVRGKTWREQR